STFIPRVLTYQSRERATFVTGMRRWSNSSMPAPAASAEARHHLAREHLHRAAHVRLRQAAEVHPAEHLADTQALHLLELRRHGVGRADGQRLGHELLPADVAQPLGHRAEARLQQRMHALDGLRDEEAPQRLL